MSSKTMPENPQLHEEELRLLTAENSLLRESLDETKTQLETMAGEMKKLAARVNENQALLADLARVFHAGKTAQEAHERRLAAMAEQAVEVQGLIVQKRAEFSVMQGNVERTLKESKPMVPHLFRNSNTVNSLFRQIKRLRKLGKMLTLQRDLNDATSQSLGTLAHIVTVIADPHSASDMIPPGLERHATEKMQCSVPRLMALLRTRLT
jgi:chromosome segregation ATPase